MQQTTHYNLNKPDPNDTYNKANDNANMDIIDAQMYENAQAAAAAQTAANNAQSTANQALEAAQNISTATTTDPGTVLVSAPPTQGQQPVAVSTTDPVYENAARKDEDNAFTAKQTFGAGFDLPSGQTGTVEGTLQAGSGGVIHATNADSLGGNPPSYYLVATGQAADSAKLNGQPASYYAAASNVKSVGGFAIEFEVASLFKGFVNGGTASTGATWGFVLVPNGTSAPNPAISTSNTMGALIGSNANTSGMMTPQVKISEVNSSATYFFEAHLAVANNVGGPTVYAALWDITASAIVSGSTVSWSTSGSGDDLDGAIVRSSSISLISGHEYALTTWNAIGGWIGSVPYQWVQSARIVAQM
ncbi:hypothetical protein AAC03nite_38140 [Alicyclobacillus acidoterrestris]|nr:hypothetical protein AAC03nite_38140 [Alicyclobacillus acidoterrestris]